MEWILVFFMKVENGIKQQEFQISGFKTAAECANAAADIANSLVKYEFDKHRLGITCRKKEQN